MNDVPARDVRNDVSGVLRRVEAGERIRVAISGRPVAELVPLPGRPRSMSWVVAQDADYDGVPDLEVIKV